MPIWQALVWNNGTRHPIPGVFVDTGKTIIVIMIIMIMPEGSTGMACMQYAVLWHLMEGVLPEGSTWARNPIPRINDDNQGIA